jgi:hypothetical protein
MATKAKAPAAPAKKAKAEAPAKEAKGAKAAAPAKGAKEAKPAKGGKAAAKAATSEEEDITNVGGETAPAVDQDEIEEAEDAAAASANGGNSNDAALAAASGSGEMSASFKNFRHHPDMENFYRFIYENDLRHEALQIIDKIMVDKAARKSAGGKSKH